MEVGYLYNRINDEYKRLMLEENQKTMKIMNKIVLVYFVTFVTTFLVYAFLGMKFMNLLTLTIFGGIFLFLMLLYLVLKYSKSSKPFYHYLMKEIYNNIFVEEGKYLNYMVLPKRDKEINKAGGLFYRSAAYDLKYRAEFKLNAYDISIDQAYIYTSTGNSTQVHLKGTYMFFGLPERNVIQVRDKWKPQLKGIKFKRDEMDKRLFVTDGTIMDSRYIRIFDHLKSRYPESKVYVSANSSGVHIGLDKEWFKPDKNLTEETFKNLYFKVKKIVDNANYIFEQLGGTF